MSSDGKHIAYATNGGGIVVDGHAGPSGPLLGGLTFSPDGKRLAYMAGGIADQRHDRQWVVVDGESGPKYVQVLNPLFSSDSKRVAYAAKSGKHWRRRSMP